MEVAYLMAGKRFQAKNVDDLNKQLEQHKLVTNLGRDGTGDLSVRRLTEPQGTCRHEMTQSVGDSADSQGFDVVVGKTIGTNSRQDIVEKEISELEILLNEVKQDIPEAKIIAGSYLS